MKQRDKKLHNDLLEIAKRMPFNYTETPASIPMRGWEILANNPDAKDSKGEPIKPDNTIYYINGTQKMPVNHYKRMKRIHMQYGEQDVKAYITEVLDLEMHAMKPVTIGGIQTKYE